MKIDSLVFSKDRPMQLHGFLESVRRHAPERFRLSVLYRASSPEYQRGYALLRSRDIAVGVRWTAESSFQDDTRAFRPETPLVCFFTDDDLLFREVGDCASALTDGVLCFSLRLGRNTTWCYPVGRANRLPSWTSEGEVLTWDWRCGHLDFGYPFSLDGHVFRSKTIIPLISALTFRNPNELEAGLQQYRPAEPVMASFSESRLVNNVINIVNSTHRNRYGERVRVGVEELNCRYLAGEVLDLDAMDFSNVRGCHQEIEPRFRRERG